MSTRLMVGLPSYLRSHGFDVELATADGPELRTFIRQEQVRWHRIPFEREPSAARDAYAFVTTVATVLRRRPDVVHASTPKAGLLGMLASRLCGVPTRVYQVRGLRYETAVGGSRTLFRWLERVAMRCATDVVFNSRSLRTQAWADKVITSGVGTVLGGGSGNGVDVSTACTPTPNDKARAELGLARDDFVVGFVGRLVRDKGVDDAVTAFQAFAPVQARARLLLVGDFEAGDGLSPEVRRAIADDDSILHVGWVDDVSHCYGAMDVLLFPSFREGLPNVPLEAQLAGVPVVAYAATGTVDAVSAQVGGRLVPIGDIRALIGALQEAAGDKPRRTASATTSEWVSTTFERSRVWSDLVKVLSSRSALGVSQSDGTGKPR